MKLSVVVLLHTKSQQCTAAEQARLIASDRSDDWRVYNDFWPAIWKHYLLHLRQYPTGTYIVRYLYALTSLKRLPKSPLVSTNRYRRDQQQICPQICPATTTVLVPYRHDKPVHPPSRIRLSYNTSTLTHCEFHRHYPFL